jgi:hypothetical protein
MMCFAFLQIAASTAKLDDDKHFPAGDLGEADHSKGLQAREIYKTRRRKEA